MSKYGKPTICFTNNYFNYLLENSVFFGVDDDIFWREGEVSIHPDSDRRSQQRAGYPPRGRRHQLRYTHSQQGLYSQVHRSADSTYLNLIFPRNLKSNFGA